MNFKKVIIMTMFLMMAMVFSACSNTNQDLTTTTVDNTLITEAETTTTEATTIIETTEETTSETATSTEVNNTQSQTNADTQAKKTLVAYFSATGTTKRVAEKIAELAQADIYEIVPVNPYSSADLDWHDNNSRTTKEMDDQNVRPEIASNDIVVSNYDTIYLGYPIWWGDAPRIMSTFVEKYNFDGIKIIPFCTSGGSGIGRSGSNLATLAKTGNWSNGERLNSSADTSNIQNFINNNK